MSFNLLLLVAFVAAVALLGSNVGLGQRQKLPSGLRLLAETGTPFIFVGVLIGPQGLDLVPANLLEKLRPILIIGFGWIGFLYGSHFEWRRMKRFKPRMYAAGLVESFLTMSVVSLGTWVVVPWVTPEVPWDHRVAMAVGLGLCAAGTAPAGVFSITHNVRISRKNTEVLQFFSAVDDLPAVLGLGVLFAVFHSRAGAADAAMPAVLRLLFEAGVGVGLGSVTHWIFPQTRDVRQTSLILLGMASLGAGAAEMLELSPIFVSVISGIVFGNLSPRKESAYGLMAAREHTLYVVFLITAGTLFQLDQGAALWLLVPGYIAIRMIGKVLGAHIGVRRVLEDDEVNVFVGTGLIFQGGMALAIAVHLELAGMFSSAHIFLSTFIWAVVVNDLLGAPLAARVLRRKERARP